ncbi:Pentatricopeptide repeat-containing protein [Forsythia ovata]|uniref:Pentatricopeptide repeat-containing protein n=1 Tax=Forsythia ovata TaxID=205694 RepID=A0ABD1X4Y4_9LAMI
MALSLTRHTCSLMLGGYAHSGQLEKMEEIYEIVIMSIKMDLQFHGSIRTMICAYSRRSDVNRVKKIEKLLKLIPGNEYRPWLNVLLICPYAKEGLLERMENSFDEAFKPNASVVTIGVMLCITASYFRHNAVDQLANFVKHAEGAGWKICRSLYHCKMVMYSSQIRHAEMERVLDEMGKVNINFSKRTLWILYKAYSRLGQRSKLQQVLGMMCKHGYEIPKIHAVPNEFFHLTAQVCFKILRNN